MARKKMKLSRKFEQKNMYDVIEEGFNLYMLISRRQEATAVDKIRVIFFLQVDMFGENIGMGAATRMQE